MKGFKDYLDRVGETGKVIEVLHSLVRVEGLPGAQLNEIVMFENEQRGYVFSLMDEYVEVLLLAADHVQVGDQVTRTDEFLEIEVGEGLLGRHIDPLGESLNGVIKFEKSEKRQIDISPPDIVGRKPIKEALVTGVRLVDLIVPLAKGQRELVIGDRKTGKTAFLLQTILTQAQKGTVCIYAAMGRRSAEIPRTLKYFQEKQVADRVVIVSATAPDAAGLIFITPYTGMAVAEYFRDQGRDVLLVLDDMTNHARYYREIGLLAGRFPGRSSYPGDIFYRQSRLIERAGSFEKGSITCLPVAESVLGDLSGYIQTNLMAMTDGHIFFDTEFYNQGRRPAINPFLSVTRVGHQVQTALARDLSREVSTFLVQYRRMQEFVHFGAELTEQTRQVLAMGEQVLSFFDQQGDGGMDLEVSISLTGFLWAGFWRDLTVEEMRKQMLAFEKYYSENANYRELVGELVGKAERFIDLVNSFKQNKEQLMVFMVLK